MIAHAEAQVEITCFKIEVLEEEVEQTLLPRLAIVRRHNLISRAIPERRNIETQKPCSSTKSNR
jgi:hypothetical protein